MTYVAAAEYAGLDCGTDSTSGTDPLAAALLLEERGLARCIRDAIRDQIASYGSMSAAELDDEVRHELAALLRPADGQRGQCGSTDRELTALSDMGERRARQGVPVEDVLRAWRIGVETVVGYGRAVGTRQGIAEGHVLEFIQQVLAWSDQAMVTTARAHRRAEHAVAIRPDQGHTDFVRDVLLGRISHSELRIRAEMYGLDPAADYVAVRACLGEDIAHCRLERILGLRDSVRDRTGLVAIVDGDAAGFLSAAPPNCSDSVVGFGPSRPLERLSESYRSAARALVTAQACGLRGAYDMASLGLRPAIVLDVEVGELLRARYLEPLAAASSEAELIATLRMYLACGMHVERTATRLFVHQNTVRYRIARFAELTGKDLSDIEVLFEVWWALKVSAMRL